MRDRFQRRCRRRGTPHPVIVPMLALALLIIANPCARAAGAASPTCKGRAAATEEFKRGMELSRQKKLDGALAAFVNSRALCPSENNTLNIVLLLKELERPVDAVEM